jgi:hypothetical protein
MRDSAPCFVEDGAGGGVRGNYGVVGFYAAEADFNDGHCGMGRKLIVGEIWGSCVVLKRRRRRRSMICGNANG